MNVQLTPEMEAMVDVKVKAGEYSSPNAVVEEALALLDRRDQAREDIRQKIEAGLESLRQGKGIEGEAAMAQMLAELDEEIREEDERSGREQYARA
jgi:putative addiction module CopG family antidote